MSRFNKIRHCCRCGYDWNPRSKMKPRVCPCCKSKYWDIPRIWSKKNIFILYYKFFLEDVSK
jgi:hypothetical protein